MESELDKTLIHIDSSVVDFQPGTKYVFSINLLEPLRDVVYIMILKTEITLKKSNDDVQVEKYKINDTNLADLATDSVPIHIHLNNYTRYSSVVANTNGEKHVAKYFEHIPVKIGSLDSSRNITTYGNQLFATFHKNNQNVYALNPIELNLQKLNFELRDMYDIPIHRDNIAQFSMTLCMYQNCKRISMA
jgi:hypothetical protein